MLRPLLALSLALALPAVLRAQSSPCAGGQAFDDGTAELWRARVRHSIVPGTTATQIQIFARAASGPLVPQGELLVDLTSPRFFVSTQRSSTPTDVHAIPIPSDVSLVGLSAASQALILAPGRIVLGNAVDLRIGC